jgi:hypothetical protein
MGTTTSTPIWFVQINLPSFGLGFTWVPLGELDFSQGRRQLVFGARFGHGIRHRPDPKGGYEYAFEDVREHEPQPESECSLVEKP